MNISPILDKRRKTLEVYRVFELSDLEKEDEILYKTPLCIKGIIRDTDEYIIFNGSLSTEIVNDCSRCLKGIDKSIELDFEVILSEEFDTWNDEYDSFIIEGEDVDLIKLANSQILQSLPLQEICDDDCKGYCFGCGVNLNNDECKCEIQTDSRFDILKQLL